VRARPGWPAALVLAMAGAAAQDEVPPEELQVVAVPEEPAAPPPAAGTQLDPITVTAQKRVQSLQETPISIDVLNREKLELRGVGGLHDLAAQVPNLTVEPFPTHNATLRLFIRGVGPTDVQLTQDPAVGVYVDGVYVARAVGLALDVADLERIEVLRGPQGTLYGRNTTGGAINLVTRRPDPGAFSMTHRVTLGSRNQAIGRSSFNVPLTDELAVKLAVLGHVKDGFVENTGPGGDFGDREESAVRFDARWIGDWLSADYAYERSDLRYYNYTYQNVVVSDNDKGQANLIVDYAHSQTLYSGERLRALATTAPLEASGTKIQGHSLTLAAPLGALELKYIGAWRDLWDAEYQDLGGGLGSPSYRLDSHVYDGPAAMVANNGQPTPLVIPTVTQNQWTHELQLGGRIGESLQVLLGAFHFSEQGAEDRHRLNHQFSSGIDAGNTTRLVQFVDLFWTIDNTALAGFGELTFTPEWLGRRTHWTAGYRHSEDRREALKYRTADNYVESGGGATLLSSGQPFFDVTASRKFRDDSFSLGAAFEATPDAHLYARAVEAYKSGGFNVRDPNVDGDDGSGTPQTSDNNEYGFGFVDGFEPEKVRSYELGAKTEWLGRSVRLNAAAFYSDYRDLQINFLVSGSIGDTKVRNAGRAEMYGLELDATWRAAPGLAFTLAGALLEATVKEVIDRNGNNVAHLFPFYSAPPYSGVAAVDWEFWDLGWGALRAYLSYNAVGERGGLVITEERRGMTALPAYGLLNGRLVLQGVAFEGIGTLEFALWGRNLADEVYEISAIDNLPQSDRAVIWGEPRAVGLELGYRFN
jgi:iron complex outermembrane recepter protein